MRRMRRTGKGRRSGAQSKPKFKPPKSADIMRDVKLADSVQISYLQSFDPTKVAETRVIRDVRELDPLNALHRLNQRTIQLY